MSKKTEYVQVQLGSQPAGRRLICWLSEPHRFKVGSVVSFRGETDKWIVLKKYSTKKEKSQLNTDWKVGGLS